MAIEAQLYSENLGLQLGGMQDLMEMNQFCYNPQRQQQQQQQQQPFPQNFQTQPHQLQSFHQKNSHNLINFVAPRKANNNLSESMPFSQILATHIEKQSIEINGLITLQNERLRLALQEQRKQQQALILRSYELKAQFLLKQKDEEIAKALNRTLELENCLRKLEIENQVWHRMAKENEAIVMSLNNTIQQVKESAFLYTNGVAEDTGSCCDVASTTENHHHHEQEQEQENHQTRKLICRACNSRVPCMIFFPCRHVSSCKACDSLLHQCPVCGMVKESSLEALF